MSTVSETKQTIDVCYLQVAILRSEGILGPVRVRIGTQKSKTGQQIEVEVLEQRLYISLNAP